MKRFRVIVNMECVECEESRAECEDFLIFFLSSMPAKRTSVKFFKAKKKFNKHKINKLWKMSLWHMIDIHVKWNEKFTLNFSTLRATQVARYTNILW